MRRLRHHWERTPRPIRRVLVAIAGASIILAGVLLLVFPGPGWAVIFLGFAVLATEFAFAERVRDRLIHILKTIGNYLRRIWRR